MTTTIVKDEIIDELEKLSGDQQKAVLQFTRNLGSSRLKGVPGKELMRFAGCIDADDLALMTKAIEDGCEQVNLDEW